MAMGPEPAWSGDIIKVDFVVPPNLYEVTASSVAVDSLRTSCAVLPSRISLYAISTVLVAPFQPTVDPKASAMQRTGTRVRPSISIAGTSSCFIGELSFVGIRFPTWSLTI